MPKSIPAHDHFDRETNKIVATLVQAFPSMLQDEKLVPPELAKAFEEHGIGPEFNERDAALMCLAVSFANGYREGTQGS